MNRAETEDGSYASARNRKLLTKWAAKGGESEYAEPALNPCQTTAFEFFTDDYHVAVDGDGVPVACVATAANVNDTLVFERLFLAAFAVMARLRTVFADKGYDAEHHLERCRVFGAQPRIYQRGQPPGSGLGQRRWPGERSNAWVLENRRSALRYDRLGFIIQSLLQSACIFLVAGRLARQF